jgi:hypothetical protein
MKSWYQAWIAVGFLAVSGVALASGDECEKMGMMGSGDAKITKEEFMKHAEEHFAHMDANGDGVIDASERKKMREHMKQCMGMKEHMDTMKKGMMGDKAAPMAKPEDGHSTPPSTP